MVEVAQKEIEDQMGINILCINRSDLEPKGETAPLVLRDTGDFIAGRLLGQDTSAPTLE